MLDDFQGTLFLFRQLGSFLRIFNLRALQGASASSCQSEEENPVAFHLHGGTTFGRGIRVLPESSPEVQELKRYEGSHTQKYSLSSEDESRVRASEAEAA